MKLSEGRAGENIVPGEDRSEHYFQEARASYPGRTSGRSWPFPIMQADSATQAIGARLMEQWHRFDRHYPQTPPQTHPGQANFSVHDVRSLLKNITRGESWEVLAVTNDPQTPHRRHPTRTL